MDSQYQLRLLSKCSEAASAPAQTNLLKLAQQVVRNRQIKEVAGDEPQIRDMTHRELIEAMPGQELRPGAFKMQLRAGEEAALPLVALHAPINRLTSLTLQSSRRHNSHNFYQSVSTVSNVSPIFTWSSGALNGTAPTFSSDNCEQCAQHGADRPPGAAAHAQQALQPSIVPPVLSLALRWCRTCSRGA